MCVSYVRHKRVNYRFVRNSIEYLATSYAAAGREGEREREKMKWIVGDECGRLKEIRVSCCRTRNTKKNEPIVVELERGREYDEESSKQRDWSIERMVSSANVDGKVREALTEPPS